MTPSDVAERLRLVFGPHAMDVAEEILSLRAKVAELEAAAKAQPVLDAEREAEYYAKGVADALDAVQQIRSGIAREYPNLGRIELLNEICHVILALLPKENREVIQGEIGKETK